jgi:hypothetical protein
MTQIQTQHLANSVIMVKPIDFGFNEQTGSDNEFQNRPSDGEAQALKSIVRKEFSTAVSVLESKGLEILLLGKPDTSLQLPDAIFPNNWFSTRTNGQVIIYPMKTENRKAEVQIPELVSLLKEHRYLVNEIIDLRETQTGSNQSAVEHQNDAIMEGTGSLIFHHPSGQLFTAISERCQENPVKHFSNRFNHKLTSFNTVSSNGAPIYHTNVLMSCGENFAVIATPVIKPQERSRVTDALSNCVDDIIQISEAQMSQSFCANILQLKDKNGEPLIAMSKSAFSGFTAKQIKRLERHGELAICSIDTIERIGGGSMRCMLAENFLTKS